MKEFKKNLLNFALFIILIIITFKMFFKNQDLSKIKDIILSVDTKYVLIGIFCMLCYYIFECINIKNVLNKLGKKVPLLKIFKYVIIGFFFSGITPAASGGQPMQIYFMHKEKIPVSYSTIALLVELMSFQIMVIIFGITGAIVNHNLLNGAAIYFFIIGLSISVIALTTMLIAFLSEKLARKIVNIFIKLLKFIRFKKADSIKEKADELLKSYATSLKLIKNHKNVFVTSIILVFVQMLFYYSIPFWICKSFGIDNYSILKIITIQGLLFCSVSSIPLPGAVGVSEGMFLNIYKNIFGETLLGSATILNRFVNFYLFIVIGFTTTIVSIIKLNKKRHK